MELHRIHITPLKLTFSLLQNWWVGSVDGVSFSPDWGMELDLPLGHGWLTEMVQKCRHIGEREREIYIYTYRHRVIGIYIYIHRKCIYIYIYRYINVVSSELFDIFFVWRSLCSRIFPKYHANETLWFVAKDGGWWKCYVRQGLSSFSDDDEDVLAAFFGTNQRNLHQQKHSLHNKTPARFTISSINKKTNSNPPGKKWIKKHVPFSKGRDYFQKGHFIFQLPILNFQVSGLVKSFIDPSLDPPGVANIPLEPIPRATSSSSRQKKKIKNLAGEVIQFDYIMIYI